MKVLRHFLLVLGASLTLRGILYTLLFYHGYFYGPAMDTFSRTYLSWTWAREPYFATMDMYWLPLQFWLGGIVFKLIQPFHPTSDVLVLVALNNLFFAGSLAITYSIAVCYAGRQGGMIAALLASTQAGDIWISLSGLSEPLYIFLILLASAMILAWSNNSPQREWLIVSISLVTFLTSATHYVGWFLSAFVSSFFAAHLLLRLKVLLRKKDVHRGQAPIVTVLPYLVVITASWIFPTIWLWINRARYGNALHFINIASQAQMPYEGKLPVLIRMVDPIRTLWLSAPILMLGAAVAVPIVARRAPYRLLYLAPSAAQFLLLTLATAAAWCAPHQEPRYMVLYTWIVIPFIAAVMANYLDSPVRVRRSLAYGACFILSLAGIVQAFSYRNAYGADVRATGAALREWIQTNSEPGNILIEAQGFAETSGIPIISGYPDRFVFATGNEIAEAINHKRDILGTPPTSLSGVRVLVLKDPNTIQTLQGLIRYKQVIGDYYIVIPKKFASDSDSFLQVDPNLRAWVPLNSGQFTAELPPATLTFGFGDPNPHKGQRAGIWRDFDVIPGLCYTIDLLIKDPYSVSAYPGRIIQQLVINDLVLWTHDISGDKVRDWQKVSTQFVSAAETVSIEISVIAMGEPESGWKWGEISRTAVKDLRIYPCDMQQ